jgi:hypothetical protein
MGTAKAVVDPYAARWICRPLLFDLQWNMQIAVKRRSFRHMVWVVYLSGRGTVFGPVRTDSEDTLVIPSLPTSI